MIIKNESGYRSSDDDYIFFINNYDKIKPIKSLNIYFDTENFLISKYQTEKGTTFVAEGWNGNQIHLTSLNCGYGGTGPSRTQEVLVYLGLTKDLATKLKHYPGLQLHFNKDGLVNLDKITHQTFFSSQKYENCKVELDAFTYVEFETNSLFFINPQFHNPKAIYSVIEHLKPIEFIYYIDDRSNSPINNYYLPNVETTSLEFRNEINHNINGVCLYLVCDQMDIYFLVDKRIARSFVNTIHYFIFQKPLFDDQDFKKLDRFGNFFTKMLPNQNEACSGTITIDKRNKGSIIPKITPKKT